MATQLMTRLFLFCFVKCFINLLLDYYRASVAMVSSGMRIAVHNDLRSHSS
jgi:hypothetical protein